MRMIRVVADDKIPFLDEVPSKSVELIRLPGHAINRSDLSRADALLVRTRTLCNAELLEGTSVRFVGTATIGTDHLDIAWLEKAGIYWTNAPGCNAAAVTQYVVCAILEIAARTGKSLESLVLGVVGVGHVGSRVAQAAKHLGMKVLLNDPPRASAEGKKGFHALSDLVRQADILSFHVPLTAEGAFPTYRMANFAFLEALRPRTWLINTARGEVVDNTALREVLRSGSLAGAVLDVWEGEPDQIDHELLKIVDIATPHIAGYSVEGKANATTQIISALGNFFGIDELREFHVPQSALKEPDRPVIRLEADTPEIPALLTVVRHCYSILRDSERLHECPDQFEFFRNEYAFRREFPAYRVILGAKAETLQTKLRGLGFQTSEC